MIPSKALADLIHIRSDTPEVVSLYLDCASNAGKKTLKELVQKAVSSGAAAPVERDLSRAMKWLEEFKPTRHRAAAVFACQKSGLFLTCPLPEPVKTQLKIAPRPYLLPVLDMLEGYRRYGVALAGEKTRFFEVYLAEIEECTPEPILGLDERKPQGMDDENHRLKMLSDGLMSLWRSKGLQRIVVGAPKEWEGKLANHLHSTLQNGLILDTSLSDKSTPEEVLEHILIGERESRKVRESVLVHRLLDAVRGTGLGVTGVQETMFALERGQVRLLLVRDGLAKMGRICTGCGRLSLGGKRCHGCYQNTEPVFDVIIEMIQQAMDSGCEVVRILHDARLDGFGGIGGELKFPNP
jgi:peptide chain release factor subunit 1